MFEKDGQSHNSFHLAFYDQGKEERTRDYVKSLKVLSERSLRYYADEYYGKFLSLNLPFFFFSSLCMPVFIKQNEIRTTYHASGFPFLFLM